jgi:anti-sigma factor RsiW
MLSCKEVSHLASDYLNRDLPLRRRLAVRLHLLMCDGCTRYVAQMRAAIALLKTMAAPSPDPGAVPPAASPDQEHARALFRSARKP